MENQQRLTFTNQRGEFLNLMFATYRADLKEVIFTA